MNDMSLTSNITSTTISSTTTKIYQPTSNYYAYSPAPAKEYPASNYQTQPLPVSQYPQPMPQSYISPAQMPQIKSYQINQPQPIAPSQYNPYIMPHYPYMPQYQMPAYQMPYQYSYASPYMNNNQYHMSQYPQMQSHPLHTQYPVSKPIVNPIEPKIKIEPVIQKKPIPHLAQRPNIFDKLNERKIKWCRYCGVSSIQSKEKFRSGPWGSKTLCGPHAHHYKGTLPTSSLRLNLSSFAEEENRCWPVLQDYCAICNKTHSSQGKCVIQCDGCPRAYHAKCIKIDLPYPLQNGNPYNQKWFCTPQCMTGDYEYTVQNTKRLPFMLSASKLAQLRRENDPSLCKSQSNTSITSDTQTHTQSNQNDPLQKFIIKFKPTKLEPFCQKMGKIPRVSIETPICEAAVFESVERIASLEAVEDMSDEAFQSRHGKYENLERYTRISLLCLESSKI